jgi:hypothetical protein
MPLDDSDRRTLLSLRNLTRLVVALLVLLLLVQGVPTLLGFLAARRLARSAEEAEIKAKPSPAQGQASVSRGSAGSIRTQLGYGIVLNKKSSLEREWVTVNNTGVPAQLVGALPLTTAYKSEGYSGEYRYVAEYQVDAKEPLTAIEVKFLTFDAWGEYQRTLSATDIEDLPAGQTKLTGEWRTFSENEASEYYASIAYVARARTKAGRVVVADVAPVIAEAKKFSERFNPAVLEASPVPSPSPRK